MSLELKAILSYSYGNYGDDPSKTSFSSHATLLNHFKNGAIFPKSGPDTLVNGFVDYLSKNGAQIYYGVTIDKIVENMLNIFCLFIDINKKDYKFYF